MLGIGFVNWGVLEDLGGGLKIFEKKFENFRKVVFCRNHLGPPGLLLLRGS